MRSLSKSIITHNISEQNQPKNRRLWIIGEQNKEPVIISIKHYPMKISITYWSLPQAVAKIECDSVLMLYPLECKIRVKKLKLVQLRRLIQYSSDMHLLCIRHKVVNGEKYSFYCTSHMQLWFNESYYTQLAQELVRNYTV